MPHPIPHPIPHPFDGFFSKIAARNRAPVSFSHCVPAFFLAVVFVVSALGNTVFGQGNVVNSFDDISFWVGEGAHESALVIDWVANDASEVALVWGYRWDGQGATTAQMLEDILKADERLYAKLGGFSLGSALFGVGYDASGDGQFALSDSTDFVDGAVRVTTSLADGNVSADANDLYREGWFLGSWHQGVATGTDANALVWGSGPGISSRNLVDGGWDSLTYESPVNFVGLATPERLFAAEETSLVGDYNRNGQIDASDFTVWRDTLGQESLFPGFGADGNFDGLIDGNDRDVWVMAFQQTSATQGAGGLLVPEPATLGIFAWIACFMVLCFRKNVG